MEWVVTMMEEMESSRDCKGGLTSGISSAHSSGGYGALAEGRLLAIREWGGSREARRPPWLFGASFRVSFRVLADPRGFLLCLPPYSVLLE
jgi:hypothetical protein